MQSIPKMKDAMSMIRDMHKHVRKQTMKKHDEIFVNDALRCYFLWET